MASSRIQRRDFLKASGLLGLSAGLSSCTTLDRLILGDFQDESDRVVVLGAGLAGLMAAFELRKQGQQVRVFEASARLGGRAYTVPDFFRGQSAAELGAEWFSGQDKILLDTALELRLEVIELKDAEQKLKMRQLNKLQPGGEVAREFARHQTTLSKAASFESLQMLSLADWVKARTRESAFQEAVEDWALEKYGTSAGNVTSAVFAPSFESAQPAYAPWISSRYRFRSGTTSLAQALFDRTAGFQPERTYSFRHKLKAVRKRGSGFNLIFDTPEGERSYPAKAVICALPLACLSEIDGLKDLPGPWRDPEALKVGQHSKFIYSFQDRFWSTELDQSKLLGFGDGQTLWESSYRLNPLFQFRQGVLSVLWGGDDAKQAGPKHQSSIEREIESLFSSKAKPELMDQVMVNWALQPFAKGSVSYPRPGAKTTDWQEATPEWAWAGEHTLYAERATLAGALMSGRQAANAILAGLRTRRESE